MGHTLPGLLADVGDHPVALKTQLLGHLGDDGKDVGHHSGIFGSDLSHGSNVSLGNHQKMGGRLGLDVVKGIDRIVLIDLVGRDLAVCDLTKQTIGHG